MKKNLLSVIILTLLIVNIVLNVIVMMSVTSTNKKTAGVITKIASAIDMDLAASAEEDANAVEVSMEDTEVYDIADTMTIPLKRGADGEDHFYVVNVSFSMDTKSKDYKTFGATIDSKASLLKSEVIDVIGNHTLEEMQADPENVKTELLARVQKMFGSDFIYRVAFSNVMYQ